MTHCSSYSIFFNNIKNIPNEWFITSQKTWHIFHEWNLNAIHWNWANWPNSYKYINSFIGQLCKKRVQFKIHMWFIRLKQMHLNIQWIGCKSYPISCFNIGIAHIQLNSVAFYCILFLHQCYNPIENMYFVIQP